MCIALEQQVSPMDGRAASHTPMKLTEDTNSYYWGKVPGVEYHAWLCAYLDGYLPPHYPVPALITQVSLYPTHVAVSVLSNSRKGQAMQVSHGTSNHDPFQFTDKELEYLYGYSEPHYPVPAIPFAVDPYLLYCSIKAK